MIISHKYKFIFVRTRKTATTSIESYLYDFLGDEDVITPIESVKGRNYKGFFNPLPGLFQHSVRQNQPIHLDPLGGYRGKWEICKFVLGNFIRKQRFYKHMPAFFIRQRVPNEVWDNYFKFTIERNPFDKVISFYYSLINTDKEFSDYSFHDYMRTGLYRCLNYPLYMDLKQKEVIVDKVVYYESLDKELGELLDYLGIPFDGLNVRAKGGLRKDRRGCMDFFTGEYEKYRAEIEKVFAKELELHGY